ncbi:beta-lactamase-like domain-containing protein [Tieghemostelium lacteum]|uniref:Beta-lactamase-like domain-containing protein n=1 Tax=Tieghemostelium lacteum TaxID=361077 RepID=A0A151ZRX1_TIELA|nr:beta-lactamase-like domain-containing protein [Tieghemostelium lacteum]|eukprot:KYQ96771.1 beta-lactamase-like domain-containing protein [Tieghemostelium lacteum]
MQKTTSVFKHGKYVNPFQTENKGIKDMFSYLWNRKKVVPLTEHERTEVHGVIPLNKDKILSPYDHKTTVRQTWLGHATVLVQMEGVTFITDPIWAKHCTPLNIPMGPHRINDPPCKISELPPIDFILISHNHYDHLDYESVKHLAPKVKTIFVPKGLKKWFTDNNMDNVVELDWYEEFVYNDLVLVPTPAHHYSQRTALDRFAVLWASWCVIGKQKRFFFSGDTAYCNVFKEIGHHYGPFDASAIAIGAYDRNRKFMSCFHVDVPEAVQMHIDLKSKRSLGIHWGTYILSDEPILEPPTLLKLISKEKSLQENEFYTSKIGETIDLVDANPSENVHIPNTNNN